MAKKRVQHKSPAERLTSAEVNARREAQQLRRLRDQQRRLVRLSGDVIRHARRYDVARVLVARELVAGTEWGVFGVAEWDAMAKRLEGAK